MADALDADAGTPMLKRAKMFMGNPCKRQHDGLRYESTGSCVHCALLYAREQKQRRKNLKPCGAGSI